MGRGGSRSFFFIGAAIIACAAIFILRGYHPIVSFITLKHMLEIGAHGYFGLGLIAQSSLASHPNGEYVDVGYINNLKLKFIYLMRFHLKDNFLWEDWHNRISNEIVAALEARNAKKDEDTVFTIPNFDYNEITPEKFFNDYVKLGRPAIIHNVPMPAMKYWNADYISKKVGNYTTDMRCGPKILTKTVDEYLHSKSDPNATVCYLDNNANIFQDNPELEADLEIERFSTYAMNKFTPPGQKPAGYFYSQMFLGIFPALGVTYHCANYGNLFFMVKGRKKWTFVDSAHSFFLYPTFPTVMRNSISRLTWYMLHNENGGTESMNKHFPLFRYAPKYVYTLQPGDMLYNPAWNWHLVENLDDESIGVASRWSMSQTFSPYTNALFSFLHFTCADFWSMAYHKIALKMGVEKSAPYKPASHFEFDDNLNFGKIGTMYKFRSIYKDIVPEKNWNFYMDYLQRRSEEHGVDYIKRNE